MEVSADGYKTRSECVKIKSGDWNLFVWLERKQRAGAKEIKRDGRFIAYDNGTVLNAKVGLMCAAKDNGTDINWHIRTGECRRWMNWKGCTTKLSMVACRNAQKGLRFI
ncbi:MAG: hypothetical protein GY749_19135 [Desulfobacteraceae bacterium]|nr:hypothetical protein [Desulfobacteraceae bacterium]